MKHLTKDEIQKIAEKIKQANPGAKLTVSTDSTGNLAMGKLKATMTPSVAGPSEPGGGTDVGGANAGNAGSGNK